MPGLAGARKVHTGRVVKARKTKTAPRVRNNNDDDDDDDDYKDSEWELGTQSLEILEKKFKELSKLAAPRGHAEKFSQKTKIQEQELINFLKNQKEIVMNSSSQSHAVLSSLFREAIGPSSDAASTFELHPLGIYGASMRSMAQELIDMHKPLQAAINSALNDLVLGAQWSQDGEDAIQILDQLKEDGKRRVERTLNGNDNGGASETKQSSWSERIKKSSQGMRRALRVVPLPVELPEE